MKEKILNTKLLPEQIALFYLGQESFLIKYRDQYILMDGYLSDYVDRQFPGGDPQWCRNYPAPISGDQLDFVDYIFCSHLHQDHADPITLQAIAAVNRKAKYIMPGPIKNQIAAFGVPDSSIISAYADEEIHLDGLHILPVPAAHETLAPDAQGHYDALGYLLQLGNLSLFHAGDTCVYDGLLERIKGTDILMLPVNGRDYFRLSSYVLGNMDAREAAILAAAAGAKFLIPMHFDLYPGNDAPPSYVVHQILARAPLLPFHLFRPGERMIFSL